MASFNKVILMGNLTRDPEMRVTPSGLAICKIGLATTRVFTTQDGERREETTFVDCDVFGRQAETIGKYMTKGRPILVEGRLRLDQWETNTGDKRSRLVVVVESFQFVGSRQGGEVEGKPSSANGAPAFNPPVRESKQFSSPSTPPAQELPQDDIDDDDVPF